MIAKMSEGEKEALLYEVISPLTMHALHQDVRS